MHFGHESRAITLLFLNEMIPLAIPYHSSPIPMSMQSLKKIGIKVLKLEHGNEAQSILTYIKGHNSVVSERNYGWVRVLHPFNGISVISRWWKGEHERLCAMKHRLGSGRISPPAGFEPATPWSEVGSANRSTTRTLQNEISPLAIPYHSSPIPMSMQSLKKIGQKALKLEHGNKALMNGQLDVQTDRWMDAQSSEGIT